MTARLGWTLLVMCLAVLIASDAEASKKMKKKKGADTVGNNGNGNNNSVQSPLRPLGLDLWNKTKGQVQTAGSDAASLAFKTNQLLSFQAPINSNLLEAAVCSLRSARRCCL